MNSYDFCTYNISNVVVSICTVLYCTVLKLYIYFICLSYICNPSAHNQLKHITLNGCCFKCDCTVDMVDDGKIIFIKLTSLCTLLK